MSAPKTLAERLQWMADHLPGFRDELDAARQATRHSLAKSLGQRQREYRQRQKFNFLISVTRDEKSS